MEIIIDLPIGFQIAQIHIPYLCIWINHHTEFVAIQSRARINLDGQSNYIIDTARQLVAQNSHVVTCVQIFYAWKLGDFMNHLD